MKPLLPTTALAFVLVACSAPVPEPAGEDAPTVDATQPDATAPPPPATTPPAADDGTAGTANDDADDDPGDDDAGAGTGDDDSAAIPQRYQGEWNSDPAACGTGNDESRLVIGADTIRFHESSGPVQSARMDGNELVVVARLTGEGETRDATYRFRISADGNTLTDAGSGLARQRCR